MYITRSLGIFTVSHHESAVCSIEQLRPSVCARERLLARKKICRNLVTKYNSVVLFWISLFEKFLHSKQMLTCWINLVKDIEDAFNFYFYQARFVYFGIFLREIGKCIHSCVICKIKTNLVQKEKVSVKAWEIYELKKVRGHALIIAKFRSTEFREIEELIHLLNKPDTNHSRSCSSQLSEICSQKFWSCLSCWVKARLTPALFYTRSLLQIVCLISEFLSPFEQARNPRRGLELVAKCQKTMSVDECLK